MDFNINPNECVSNIVNTIKSNGSFDQFRRECLSDVDTKPSYRNLIQRVDICVNKFFSKQSWNPSLNKAQLRNRLRNEINDADQVRNGIHHLVDQIVNTKVRSEFKEKIEKSLKDYLGIKDPEEAPIESEESSSKPGNDESAANDQKDEDKNIENVIEKKAENELSLEENSESRTSASELCTKQYDESSLDVADVSHADSASNSTTQQFADESVATNDGSESPSKDESDHLTITASNEILESTESTSNVVKEEEADMKEPAEMSDLSSVHTSDLSDFDDEISISSDDDGHKDSKKKKISLKVVKELTASIFEEKKSTEIEVDDSSEQGPSTKIPENSGKGKKQEIKEGASTRQSLKRKQGEAPAGKGDAKLTNLRTRQASLSSEFAEKTPAEKRGRGRPKKAMPADPNSSKRYDSSDLYKPRNSLANTSSRRTRAAADLDSNSNSTADDL
ncbi:COMPASS (Complex proteins associated with Set1p) component shg1 [Tyrophagus putrescentiae]|nr:COMPASS (Complex proteins associated with Set1p) component shg1 [Tyrophagus putrescentiae]